MIRSTLFAVAAIASPAAPPAAPVPPETPAGADFLARNGAAAGVVTVPSGIEYFVIASGARTGMRPGLQDLVTLDYEVKLLNGQLIDSSFGTGQPLTGTAGSFVPGFSQALELMRPGDEWIVWIPPQLAYGSKDTGPIPANSVLRFRIVLHSVAPAR